MKKVSVKNTFQSAIKALDLDFDKLKSDFKNDTISRNHLGGVMMIYLGAIISEYDTVEQAPDELTLNYVFGL